MPVTNVGLTERCKTRRELSVGVCSGLYDFILDEIEESYRARFDFSVGRSSIQMREGLEQVNVRVGVFGRA